LTDAAAPLPSLHPTPPLHGLSKSAAISRRILTLPNAADADLVAEAARDASLPKDLFPVIFIPVATAMAKGTADVLAVLRIGRGGGASFDEAELKEATILAAQAAVALAHFAAIAALASKVQMKDLLKKYTPPRNV
jgi:hypothetical protein